MKFDEDWDDIWANIRLQRQSSIKHIFKSSNQAKFNKTKKLWYLIWHKFWPLLIRYKFGGKNGPSVYLHPNLRSLKFLGNSPSISFSDFIILNIKFCFVWSELNVYGNRKFPNYYVTLIVDNQFELSND